MLKFRLDEIVLVSHKERRGRRISFHPKVTIIKGPNDTGKSSIVKNILETFGAETLVHHRWKTANVSALVRFAINGNKFSIFRNGPSFSLFDAQNSLLGTYQSVTNDLGPQIAKIFDFKLRLVDRRGVVKTPPPAYLLLPFYIDQDQGWQKPWSSFNNLQQFKSWRKDTVLYHTGIRPNLWYELNGKVKALEVSRDEPLQRERVLKGVITRVEAAMSNAAFDINLTSYKREINRLLRRCEELKTVEEEYKIKLMDLENEKTRVQLTREIIAQARHELGEDYYFATNQLEDGVECPICGTAYENDLEARFAIAHDEDKCVGLLQELQSSLHEIEAKIELQKQALTESSKELRRINSILTEKQGRLTLKNIIENEGKREVSTVLFRDLKNAQEDIARIELSLREIKQQLHQLENKDRRREILDLYREEMQRYCQLLNVTQLSGKAFKQIDCSIVEVGSDLPRAILAYFLTILKTIQKYGAFESFPVIIDAPNQQEQDQVNIRKMLEVIRDYRPANTQLIMGLVDDYGIDFGGALVNMTEPNYALRQEEYEQSAEVLRQFSVANLNS